jgi:hypothetical protein
MKKWLYYFLLIIVQACSVNKTIIQVNNPSQTFTGSSFYDTVAKLKWQERETIAVDAILKGNMPKFLFHFVPVYSSYTDSLGKKYEAIFYVSSDYLSIGTNTNWARIPLTPMAAQKIADSFHCFLPTIKMVDLIYEQAKVKLAPQPMLNNRDSSNTMFQHHVIIEEQRKKEKGLIAGIKKDVVLSNKIFNYPKQNKVAIYGWHQINGKPIQPEYSGHVNWYVDYSHGIRLIARSIIINHKKMDYIEVLQHPVFKHLLSNENSLTFYKYNY